MPYIITAPMRSDPKQNTRKKNNQKNIKNKNLTKTKKITKTAKTEYLNLKGHSNNVKMQSDKPLTTQIKFRQTTQRTESFLNGTMLQVKKEND